MSRVHDGKSIRRSSAHGNPGRLLCGYQSYRSMGTRDAETVSKQPDGTEIELPAWSIPRPLRRGIG